MVDPETPQIQPTGGTEKKRLSRGVGVSPDGLGKFQ